MQSRRDVLRTTAGGTGVGLLAALAGCSDETSTDDNGTDSGDGGNGADNGGEGNGNDNGGEENGNNTDESDEDENETTDESVTATQYVDWGYDPEALSDDSIYVMKTDPSALLAAEPSSADVIRRYYTSGYGEGLEPDDITSIISVGRADILSGSFAPNEVIDETPVADAESYANFEFYDHEEEQNTMIATDGELLMRSEPGRFDPYEAREELELLIDTAADNTQRFVDENETFARMADETAAGDVETVSSMTDSAIDDLPDDAVTASSRTASVGSTETSIEHLEVYHSEDGIDIDELESEFDSPALELDHLSRDGRTVTIEWRISTDTYLGLDG